MNDNRHSARDGGDGDGDSSSWFTLLGIGTGAAAMFAGGLALGWWLDGLLHTSPALVLVGMGVGLVAAFLYTFFEIRKSLQD